MICIVIWGYICCMEENEIRLGGGAKTQHEIEKTVHVIPYDD